MLDKVRRSSQGCQARGPAPPKRSSNWNPDPSGAPTQRYLNGKRWTDQLTPALRSGSAPSRARSHRRAAGVTLQWVRTGAVLPGAHRDRRSTAHACTEGPQATG
ncbi:DUF2510 domain-containing protein [Mycolicibacterium setense]|uniref:DUF2510 domain-containing protein n=1 Tax=Mycolicibacterium setense TaxID=431269 RepID=UPI0009EE78A4